MKKTLAVAVTAGAVVLGGAGIAAADAYSSAVATGSPGVISGNIIKAPIHVPINVCGNTVDVIGLLNPAFGAKCLNN